MGAGDRRRPCFAISAEITEGQQRALTVLNDHEFAARSAVRPDDIAVIFGTDWVIEVDTGSAVINPENVPIGALVANNDGVTSLRLYRGEMTNTHLLFTNFHIEETTPRADCAFTRWKIMIGAGEERREIVAINAALQRG
jgi:hypothetical protein